jgi:sulfopyruvate decarboxylase subunit beta
MKRIEALEAVYGDIRDCVVVTIMGAVAVELFSLGHRQNFFYLEHAMGLASSMGLGIAVSRPDQKVVVIDGDGSALMNLGTFTTLARYAPPNLIHIVFDNESLLSVGGFPTATAVGTDLAGIARAAGVPYVESSTDLEGFQKEVKGAIDRDLHSCIVAKVDAIGPPSFAMDLTLLENRFEFARYFTVDLIAPEQFVGMACVIDVTSEADENADFLLSSARVRQWEQRNGRIPPGSWVLLRTGWSRRAAEEIYLNVDENGSHTPGWTCECSLFLAEGRDVLGVGVETVGTDAGQAAMFDTPFCNHFTMHRHGKFGLASLCNLDQLPPTGAVVIAAPLKIVDGSGSPVRAIALVET